MSKPSVRITAVNDARLPTERPVRIESTTEDPLTAAGTRDNPANTVTCTLTGPDPETKQAVNTGRASWSVDFGNKTAGLYHLVCSAPGEPTDQIDITVT